VGSRSGLDFGRYNTLFVLAGVYTPAHPNRDPVTSKNELPPLREINRSQALCFPRAKNRIYKYYPDRAILGFRHADEMTLKDGTDRSSRNVEKELQLQAA
jgi:hypothetical protein